MSLKPLRFGIPSLDQLIGTRDGNTNLDDFGVSDGDGSASVCLMGPDGAGKSILALHLASRYAMDCKSWHAKHPAGDSAGTDTETYFPYMPQVLYVSTDLHHQRAEDVWDKFGLADPNNRKIPHYYREQPYQAPGKGEIKLKLQRVLPPGHQVEANDPGMVFFPTLDEFLRDHTKAACDLEVGFVDLAAYTAGDDWSYVNRILSVLSQPARSRIELRRQPCHLMIIDAIEGLEVLTGDHDAFGERRNRRSRIAQLVRTAAGKCHLVFVVEEMKDGERLAEEFVADLVLRLRAHGGATVRRTVEVVKSRGQAHQSGQHDYVIRNGEATLTGNMPNPDEPANSHATIHVMHGVDSLFQEIASQQEPVRLNRQYPPTFGIRYLDPLFGYSIEDIDPDDREIHAEKAREKERAAQAEVTGAKQRVVNGSRTPNSNDTTPFEDTRQTQRVLPTSSAVAGASPAIRSEGIGDMEEGGPEKPCPTREDEDYAVPVPGHPDPASYPTLTALIGDVATFKTTLGCGFLSECFSRKFYWPLGLNPWAPEPNDRPFAILLTTQLTDASMLAGNIYKMLSQNDKVEIAKLADCLEKGLSDGEVEELCTAKIEERLLCRRFPVRDLSSAHFFHIIECAIWKAREKLGVSVGKGDRWRGPQRLNGIRLVIDDWHIVKTLYPDVARNSQLLPFLTQYLQWQQVSALFIDTQSGDPETIRRGETGRDLRNLVQRHIYTWHVPFYKQDRIAVAVLPSLSESIKGQGERLGNSVRELRAGDTSQRLIVDPHFERYYGLERGDAHPLPLQVMLYTGSSGAEQYLDDTDALLRQFFSGAGDGRIVYREDAHNYEALRQLAYTPRGTRLNTTLILQVDEFWQHSEDQIPSDPKSDGARFSLSYLNAKTVDVHGEPTPEDPFLVYQPTKASLRMIPRESDARAEAVEPRQPDVVLQTTDAEEQGVHSEKNAYDTDKLRKEKERKTTTNRRRHSFFAVQELQYSDSLEEPPNPNRVEDLQVTPMIWDFGFLLCRRRAWIVAGDKVVRSNPKDQDNPVRVVDIWDPHLGKETPPSWFDFFKACKIVAKMQKRQGHSPPIFAFDIDQYGPSSISCLILEIWASELLAIRLECGETFQIEDYFPAYRSRPAPGSSSVPPDKSLIDLVSHPKCRAALLRALMLLFGVTEPEQFYSPLVNKERGADPSAVASRHWYSTAVRATQQWDADDPLIPVRLPGSYSVRGDWFLTIADGSQSPQLARSAMDLLTSTRANLRRMEIGVGLPTRRIYNLGTQPTGLFTVARPYTAAPSAPEGTEEPQGSSRRYFGGDYVDDGNPDKGRRRLRYDELRLLGVQPRPKNWAGDAPNTLHWLWRSRIKEYHRHARVWNRWIVGSARQWHRRTANTTYEELDAFSLYEELIRGDCDVAIFDALAKRKSSVLPSSDELKVILESADVPEAQQKNIGSAIGVYLLSLDRLIADLEEATQYREVKSSKRKDGASGPVKS